MNYTTESLAEMLAERGLEVAVVGFRAIPTCPLAVVAAVYRKADRVPVQGYVYAVPLAPVTDAQAGSLAGEAARMLKLRPGSETGLDVILNAELPLADATKSGDEGKAARDALAVLAAAEYLKEIGALQEEPVEEEEVPFIPGNIH
jgi:hypothetical protein